jgi:hypothetical protein
MGQIKETLIETRQTVQEIMETYQDAPLVVLQTKISMWNLDRMMSIVNFSEKVCDCLKQKLR